MNNKKRAYIVSTAHLDTVWRWNLSKTIEEFIPDTLTKNFDLLEKYPNYRFNFEGAYRYELIEEFYPKAFEIIKEYVKQGRWCISGTAYENGDVNIPSPEALFRNILIGNEYFTKKFGTSSKDLFLPDCFGFGAALPAVIRHAGLKGFTTQKLSWGSAYGLPFDLGIYKGIDGSEIFASLNARSYRYKFTGDIRADLSVIDRIADNAQMADLPWSNHLYGTGDWGGAPTEESVRAVNESVNSNKNYPDFEVISAKSDQVFYDLEALSNKEKSKLPVFDKELLMTSHGAGCYTSRAMSKRLNRQNERLASATEKACAYATELSAYHYPKKILNQAWKRVIKHQFHDDITGTSNMDVYNDSWGDYFLSLSQFKNEYLNASKAIISRLDTSWVDEKSNIVVVNNPTQFVRKETVELTIRSRSNCNNIAVFDKNGNEVPSQLCSKMGKMLTIVFLAEVKPFGYRAYEIKPTEAPCSIKTAVKATNHSLENEKYKLIFNKNGDIAYLYDKQLRREIIDAPIKMALLRDTGALSYPSWEIKKEDLDKEPYCYANTPVFTVLENGPARCKIKVERIAENSKIIQTVSLSANSQFVKVDNIVDWRTRRTMLKATFPTSAHNKKASYDLGIGVIERSNNKENLYEVPAQNWADITDQRGHFGVSILSDCKMGWDKPNDNTLRLTCIHTPAGAFTKESRQDLQDIGRNIFSFAIYSHENGYANGTQMQSDLFNNPMLALQTEDRRKRFLTDHESFCTISNNNALIKAIKYSEDRRSDIIIRVSEGNGVKCTNVNLKLSKKIKSAYLCNALEENIKELNVTNRGTIRFNLNPFETKTFRIDCGTIPKKHVLHFTEMKLPFNAMGFTDDSNMRNVILQGSGFSLPYELLPERIHAGGIGFKFTQKSEELLNQNNVLVCNGQEISVPKSSKRIYFIAGSSLGAQEVKITLGKKRQIPFNIKSITEPISRWDMAGLNQVAAINQNDILGIEFTHTHHPEGNKTEKARFYIYSINVKGYNSITLPDNSKIVILAMTAVDDNSKTVLASNIEDNVTSDYSFDENLSTVDKIRDKADFVTIRAGKIQDQMNSGKGKGFKRDNIVTNIIRSYTKSEW